MVIGKKFWPIKATSSTPVSYDPASNPGASFGGTVVGDNTIEVGAAVATAIGTLLGSSNAGVGISGQYIASGTTVLSASGTTITLNKNGIAPCASAALTYWDLDYPSAAGRDSAIQAVLCINSGDFVFTDYSGKAVVFSAGDLVAGAVYYFQILEVYTATDGDYIGYSAQ
jgi:hypothetical protein